MSKTKKPSGNSWAGFAEAFAIFAKYGEGELMTRAEHDEIYAGPDQDTVMDDADLVRLKQLGWYGCDEGGFRKNV